MGKLAPSVEIDLDKPRRLVFDLNAMCVYERASGKRLTDLDLGLMSDLQVLLWACLQDDDPELHIEQVGKLIHGGNMSEVYAALTSLWADSLPEANTDTPKAPRKKSKEKELIGQDSGP